MTNEEFSEFTKRLFVAFPSILDWLRNKSPDMLATQALWRKTLANYTLSECDSVLDRWVSGELAPPTAYERDVTAVFIRQVIERDQSRRRPISEAPEYTDKKQTDASPIAPLVADLILMAKRGAKDDELKRRIDQAFPESPAYDQPRYKCVLCLDRGLVEVWRNDFARHVADGKLTIDQVDGSYNVACTCAAGDNYANPNEHWHAMPRYQPDQYCRYKNEAIEIERQRLECWLKEKQKSRLSEFSQYARAL